MCYICGTVFLDDLDEACHHDKECRRHSNCSCHRWNGRWGGREYTRSHCRSAVNKFWCGWQWRCGQYLFLPVNYYVSDATLYPNPPGVWWCEVCKTDMIHDFDEAFRHEERWSKEPHVVVSGNRADGSSGVRVGTVANPTDRVAMKVTDTRKSDDDIVTTISDRQHAERRGGGSGCKAQDKSGVRKVGLSLSP